jgi:glycosyltransferase involved in cell wall biosynthesis
VPIVLLPHFHLEDRYYHWKAYYEAFRNATAVLAAPAHVKTSLLDVIGAHGVVVPGGGVHLEEFQEPALGRARQAFSALRRSEVPFALVLGRKAAGKNYAIAVEAIRLANRTHEVDLVMIGPDEDGIPVTESHVRVYGSQPRQVVIGALANATCVVNMSDSESFGIVLLEAWSAGTPVIAQRRCVAFTELVVDQTNGILAESTEEVARAILAYAAQPEVATRHAANGRVVAEAHSWRHLAEQVEETLTAATRLPSSQSSGAPSHVR